MLISVPKLSQALENLYKRRERLIARGAPQEFRGIDYSKPFTDSGYVSDTLSELLEFSECTKNIAQTQETLETIMDVINQLSDKHKKIITLWYIEKESKETVMEELEVESLTTVYNMKNRAVAEFALLYYGASAIPSI